MSKKPRNKRYSPERNYARAARHAVSPLAIVYAIHNEPKIVHAATGRSVALTDVIYRAFHTVRYQWTVYTAVMLETSTGERYYNIRECSPERECYKEDIADALKDEHLKQIASTKKADRVSVGWVGFPKSVDVPESDIARLLETIDFWEQNERGSMLLDSELTIDQQLMQMEGLL